MDVRRIVDDINAYLVRYAKLNSTSSGHPKWPFMPSIVIEAAIADVYATQNNSIYIFDILIPGMLFWRAAGPSSKRCGHPIE